MLFSLLFTVVFVLVIGVFVVTFVKSIGRWNQNNNSPRLTVPAMVVTKRSSGHHHDNHYSTSYYVTFQFESGDRLELHVMGTEYGLLVEGDCGNLTFQGTRYLGFERQFNRGFTKVGGDV